MKLSISANGVNLIASFEGLSLTAYKAISSEKYYTIGYGHYGKEITKDTKITKQEALSLLQSDCKKFEKKVNKYMNTYHFNQNQFDALVSFAYNIGNIDGLTKNGTRSIKEIERVLPSYNKAGGKVLNGLTKRRNKELELFKQKIRYFPLYRGNSLSIIEALEAIGVNDTSFTYRKQIAIVNHIANYKGTYLQNVSMVKLLKKGNLIEPIR